jgi:hypothetical protein
LILTLIDKCKIDASNAWIKHIFIFYLNSKKLKNMKNVPKFEEK